MIKTGALMVMGALRGATEMGVNLPGGQAGAGVLVLHVRKEGQSNLWIWVLSWLFMPPLGTNIQWS